jgi:FkbM family methyltransferase
LLSRIPYLGRRAEALLAMRNSYRNWFEIVLTHLLRKPLPEMLFLRKGTKIRGPEVDGWWTVSRLSMLLRNMWSVEDFDGEVLRLAKAGLVFRLRFIAADLSQLRDIFDLQTYGADFSDKVVLDVGMYNGDSAVYFATKGAKFVIGLEPFHESYELARLNIDSNSFSGKVIPLNVALASSRGQAELQVAPANPLANSLQPTVSVAASERFDTAVAVETTTIEALVREYALDRIDYLKMNCEGCEYDVIRNLEHDLFNAIREVFLQFHNGPQDLPEILKREGFQVDLRDGAEGFLHARRIADQGSH